MQTCKFGCFDLAKCGLLEFDNVINDNVEADDAGMAGVALYLDVEKYAKTVERYASMSDGAHGMTKKKNIAFEEMIGKQYKANAKCATFRTNKERVFGWIHSLQSRYYNDLARSDEYLVDWLDDPSKDELVITVKDQTKMAIVEGNGGAPPSLKLVTITLYMSTLTIMVQGNEFEKFVQGEFPALKQCVDIVLKLVNPSQFFDQSTETLNENGVKDLSEPPVVNFTSSDDEITELKRVAVANFSVNSTGKSKVDVKTKRKMQTKSESAYMEQIAGCLENFIQMKDMINNIAQQMMNRLLDTRDDNHKLQLELINRELQQTKAELSKLKSENEKLQKEKSAGDIDMKMKEELEKIRCEVEKLRVEKKNHVDQIKFLENNRKRMADELDNMDGRMKQKNADLETAYMRQKQKDSDMEAFELRIKKLNTQLSTSQDEIISLKTTVHAQHIAEPQFEKVPEITKKKNEKDKQHVQNSATSFTYWLFNN